MAKGTCFRSGPWLQVMWDRRVHCGTLAYCGMLGPGSASTQHRIPGLPPLPPRGGDRTRRVPISAYQAQLPSWIIFRTTQKTKRDKSLFRVFTCKRSLTGTIKSSSALGSSLVESLVLHSCAPKEQAWLHPAHNLRICWLLRLMLLYSEYFTICC